MFDGLAKGGGGVVGGASPGHSNVSLTASATAGSRRKPLS